MLRVTIFIVLSIIRTDPAPKASAITAKDEMGKCKSNLECSAWPNKLCINGFCMESSFDSCINDADCPWSSQRCLQNRCLQFGKPCKVDSDCPFGDYRPCSKLEENNQWEHVECQRYRSIFCIKSHCTKIDQICRADSECRFYPEVQCLNSQCAKVGQPCEKDQDCPFHLFTSCIESKCVKLATCSEDIECAGYPRYSCVDSLCAKLGQLCNKALDCPYYWATECVNSRCVKLRQPCDTDTDCPYYPNTACIGSKCEKIGQTCQYDMDCPFYPETPCLAGRCAKKGGSCQIDSECPNYPLTGCVLSQCTKIGEICWWDEDCSYFPYMECLNSTCKRVPTCVTDNDCGSDVPRECIKSLCLKRRLCRNNAECPLFPKNVCSNTHCVKLGKSCSSDKQCLGEKKRRCVKSTCIRLDLPCTFDQDCPFHPYTYCHENECMKTEPNATILQNPLSRRKSRFRKHHRAACFQTTLNDTLRELLVKVHNNVRRAMGKRTYISGDQGKAKRAKTLYELKYSCQLDMASIVSISDCLNISSITAGVNVFQIVMPSPITRVEEVVRSAMRSWCWYSSKKENKTTVMSYANIVYYKTLALGCAYRFCRDTTPMKHVLLCHYSDKPTTEELENPSSTACKNDDDCALVPDSYCRNFLCVAHKLQVPWNA